jgi:hypothetical protein
MTRGGWNWVLGASLTLLAMPLHACVFGHHFDDDDEGFFDDDDGFDDDDAAGTGAPPPPVDVEPPCPVGAPGCPCTSQGVCDPDLECVASIHTCVVPDSCAIGAAGCACTAGGTCDPGFICKEEICVSEAPCHPEFTGTEGCQCTEGGGCDPELECYSNFCVRPPQESTGSVDGSSSG